MAEQEKEKASAEMAQETAEALAEEAKKTEAAELSEDAEDLGREARNLVVNQIRDGSQGVADAEIAVGDQSHDVAWIGGLDGFAVLPEESLWV